MPVRVHPKELTKIKSCGGAGNPPRERPRISPRPFGVGAMADRERLGLGFAALGVGLSLVVGLPPNWWPKMPEPYVTIGLCVGVILTIVGSGLIIVSIYGRKRRMTWPVFALDALLVLSVLGLIIGIVLRLQYPPFADAKSHGLVSDGDYFFFWVDIREPKTLTASLPVWFTSKSASPFENPSVWWAPWQEAPSAYPMDTTNPYYSIGAVMKVPFGSVRGGGSYGRAIPAGDYFIQYDVTFKGLNYHFDERLNIQARNGALIQKIDVWRTIPGEKKTLVYSGDHP